MDNFETIKICTQYKIGNKSSQRFPSDINKKIKPVYKEFLGWKKTLSNVNNYEQLPQALKEYVNFIEKETGIPIRIISTGPDRNQTIIRY
jgi:adenylosuccinate synthase